MHSHRLPRRALRVTAVLAASGALVGLSGCAQIIDAFNGGQPETVVTPSPSPSASPEMAFDSMFTYDGSVSLTTDVADGLEVRIDVWAADPKRTLEWTPDADKTFGFAINVRDDRVDEKAVLTEKRRVYISQLTITSQTAQASGQTSAPFRFSADPRTLVPTDTLRSDRGLLLNSFQGGLLVPETTIQQLPADTYGITLEFVLEVSVEQTADDDDSFQEQTIYQVLPIAITTAE